MVDLEWWDVISIANVKSMFGLKQTIENSAELESVLLRLNPEELSSGRNYMPSANLLMFELED